MQIGQKEQWSQRVKRNHSGKSSIEDVIIVNNAMYNPYNIFVSQTVRPGFTTPGITYKPCQS